MFVHVYVPSLLSQTCSRLWSNDPSNPSSSPLLKLHSFSPIIQRAGELSACLCEFLWGSKEGKKVSWNRFCWWRRAPTAGNVSLLHGPLKSLSEPECSSPLRVFTTFHSVIYLSSTTCEFRRRGSSFIKLFSHDKDKETWYVISDTVL